MKYSDICNADSALQKGTLPQENGGFGGDGGETIEKKLHSESYRCTRKEKSILVKKKKEMTISTTMKTMTMMMVIILMTTMMMMTRILEVGCE